MSLDSFALDRAWGILMNILLQLRLRSSYYYRLNSLRQLLYNYSQDVIVLIRVFKMLYSVYRSIF